MKKVSAKNVVFALYQLGFNPCFYNISSIQVAIEDEYKCGLLGTIKSIIRDLNDSVGIEAFSLDVDQPEPEPSLFVSYVHAASPSIRFVQRAIDPLPSWAADVRPHIA